MLANQSWKHQLISVQVYEWKTEVIAQILLRVMGEREQTTSSVLEFPSRKMRLKEAGSSPWASYYGLTQFHPVSP